jgi:oxygen-dependent protoporphyrinogen oxidase
MRVAIIGGGIAGLSAAYELELARESGADVEYALFEAGSRLGGVVASALIDGTVLELGPDSFLTEKPAAAELCRELGLEASLIGSNDATRKTYILVRKKLVPLPDGLMFLVPTKLVATALSPLFSLRTKMRMAMEFFRSSRPAGADESVASLVARHYGQEVVDRLADPLLSGIYGGDAGQLSAQAVLPRFVAMEAAYGSLTRGMLAGRRKMRGVTAGKAARPIFTTLKGGLQQMIDALVARLDSRCLQLDAPVGGLAQSEGGWLLNGQQRFDAVIVATPAGAAADLVRSVDLVLSETLAEIPYTSSITVNLVYDKAALGPLPEGFGFLVPAVEGRALLACTFVHRKFAGRTAPGKAVLRAFLGGARDEELLNASDASLGELVREELRAILGIVAVPERVQVQRWKHAMAQYSVGHQERIRRVRERVAMLPGLHLVGNAYDGIGISDCIRLGRAAARRVAAR